MRMQVCDCLVGLGAKDIASITTMKKNVTVPEAMFLNTMHGGGGVAAVTHITNIREIETTPVKEKARLVRLYVLGPQDDEKPHLLDKLFPGLSPRFPETFTEAGFEIKATDLPFPVHDPKAETVPLDDEFEFYDGDGKRVNEDGSPWTEPAPIAETPKAQPLGLKGAEAKLASLVKA